MGGDLFGDLPPPTYHSSPSQEQSLQLHKSVKINEINTTKDSIPLPPPPLKSALKSALKRPVPPELTSPNGNFCHLFSNLVFVYVFLIKIVYNDW